MNPNRSEGNALGADCFLGPTRVRINHNGSGHAGDQSRPLAALLERMEQHALDTRWSDDGLFCERARGAIYLGKNKQTGESEFADTGPIYADAPNAVRFWGNFETYSHSFSVDTDDAEVIELLTAAVEANRKQFSSPTTPNQE